MMTTDFRALCAELLAGVDEYVGMNPYMRLDNAMKAARLALAAEPETPANCPGCEGVPAPGNQPCAVCGKQASPPSPVDGEVAELVTWLWSMHELAGEHNPEEQCRYERTADLLERLAPQPVPEGPIDGPAVQSREPASVMEEPSDEAIESWAAASSVPGEFLDPDSGRWERCFTSVKFCATIRAALEEWGHAPNA